jgi:two-component system NtrC family sensor kinase
VIAANDAFLRRSGRERGEILGMACHDTTSGMCGPGDCPTLATIETGKRQVRICERTPRPGVTMWEEVHSSPIMGPSGTIVQVVEVWRDISQRRAAEAQMAESHRLASLGLLASGFSHELNTPLATVLACVEGILRDEQVIAGRGSVGWDRIEENARIAREQILRCRGITQHFLRLSSGKSSEMTLVDLSSTFAAVVPLISPMAKSLGVTIEVDPPPPGARVRVNDAELQQVLLNLLLNAVQACGPKGRIHLSAGAGDPVRIRVADDGRGIAPENLRRIFEPFFSLREGGTGLGLFLSMNFVRRWGGDLAVSSTPGTGSTFEVVLPGLGPPS